MRAGDFVGAKIYRKPTEDKRTKKDGTPRSPKKLGKIHFPVFTRAVRAWSALWSASPISRA